jgi:hypothetical protein
MTVDDWPPVAPPLEAYSRVTDPGRFRPLHPLALDLLEWLDAEYEVSRTDVFDLLPGMAPFEHALPPIRLTPTVPTAAPIAVAFTTFPSLLMRCGRWLGESFPSCGCDACRETAEGEGERLQRTLGDVVAGRFREQLSIPLFGQATLTWELGAVTSPTGHRRGGRRVVPRARARALLSDGPRVVQWQPWPARAHGTRGSAGAIGSRPLV